MYDIFLYKFYYELPSNIDEEESHSERMVFERQQFGMSLPNIAHWTRKTIF